MEKQNSDTVDIDTLKQYLDLGIKLIPAYERGAFISGGNPRDFGTNDINEIQSLIKGNGYRDGIGQEFEAVIKKIGECPKKSIILIDYMQRLPVPEGFQSAQRYLQIQKSSEVLLKTAIENQLIVIAGAQLKREDNNKGQETAPSMDSIRESGDIEQDAHNVVILNKDYAEVAKSRESGETAKKMNIKAVKQFVFWETNGEGEYDDSPARKNLKHVKKPELENSLKTFKPAPKNSTNI